MKSNKTIILLLVFFISIKVYSQQELNWGKLTNAEIELTECDFDEGASAVILYKKGNLSFSDGYVKTDIHIRIKILKKEGFDYATQKIDYISLFDIEKIKKLKAQTININEKGKIEKTRVKKNQIFETENNSVSNNIAITFPAVKVGSILEFKYTHYSSIYKYIEAWQFQNELPTIYSEFSANFKNSYLDFEIFYIGERLVNLYSEKMPAK